jgi:hypothetical protein
MRTPDTTLPPQVIGKQIDTPAAGADFISTAKKQFISFFQNKGFTCVADAVQQLKATYKKLTVRFSVSDPKIAADQGHAVCYLSFAPLNKRYKIAIGNIEQDKPAENAYTYTLMEDTFAKTPGSKQKSATFYSFEELLNTVFPKTASLTGSFVLQSFFSFLF